MKKKLSMWRKKKQKPIRHNYSIGKLLKLRDNLIEIMAEFEGKTPRGDKFDRLVQLVWENLPGRLNRETLYESLRNCAGTLMTKELIRETCWRIAGNLPRLRLERVTPPWHVQRFAEWVPLHILSARPHRRGKKMGAMFTMRIMAGTPCPFITFKWWSVKRCRYYARNGFGFSKRPGAGGVVKYPYVDPAQLVNLRLYGLVEPELCGKEPGISEPRWPASVRNWNKEIIRRRFRVDQGYSCPQGFPLELACHHCPVGTDRCPAGTHRQLWRRKYCEHCEREGAVFDPEISHTMCTDCYRKAVFKGEL